MVKVAVKHCDYSLIEETANSLLGRLKDSEQFRDLKVIPISKILFCVMLVYCEDNK